jgi:hypothetical protein
VHKTLSDLSDEDIGKLIDKMPTDKLKPIIDNIPRDRLPNVLKNTSMDGTNKILDNLASTNVANPDTPLIAAYVTRIPEHEPWARTYTKSDTDKSPKYNYDDQNIGKEDGPRNEYWSR